MDLKNYIRDIQDFPEKGILFKDITPLLGDASAFKQAQQQLLKLVGNIQVDKVVCMESRGFFFGPGLAQSLQAGFVPIRKPGKLPFDTEAYTYNLEYGTDTLEIHKDAIKPGDRILIHDDVLATGGTAAAAVALVESLGGEVVQCNFLIALRFLKGEQRLETKDIKALLCY